MGHYTQSDKHKIIRPEDFQALYNGAHDLQHRTWITILYLTAARPEETLQIKKKDITINTDHTIFLLTTLKLGEQKTFVPHYRNLKLNLSKEHSYIQTITAYIKRFNDTNSKIFPFNIKTGYNIVHNLGYNVLGISICPYNFRHSRLTLLAEHGATEEELKRFKGSFTTSSVRAYLHVRKVEYTIDLRPELNP